MPPAVAIAGAAVVGGAATAISGSKAAKAQKSAAATAAAASERGTQLQIEEQRRQYDQTRADYAPYRETGYKALDTLAGLYGVGGTRIDPTAALEATPGYQFQRDQGLSAIDRANSARGALNSGGADKSRIRYASGLAASNYENFANWLASGSPPRARQQRRAKVRRTRSQGLTAPTLPIRRTLRRRRATRLHPLMRIWEAPSMGPSTIWPASICIRTAAGLILSRRRG